ncbi:MAG: hypothetical protein D6732_18230 [Methanobacteriota archaeon]|nr:MAG: hypothetical protein D6732_18230 [Euryarchaeota archaeon]
MICFRSKKELALWSGYNGKIFRKGVLWGIVWVLVGMVFEGSYPVYAQSQWGSNLTSDVLYTDPPQSNVGIGTSTPTAPLEIYRAGGLLLFLKQDPGAGAGSTFGSAYLKIQADPNYPAWTMGLHGTDNDFWIGQSDALTDAKLVIRSNGGNVGIGTSSPDSRLSVNGDIDINGSRFYVGTDGKVGIGTNVPTTRLHIKGENGVANILKLEEFSSNHILTVSITSDGTVKLQGTNGEVAGAYTNILLNPAGGGVGIGTTNVGSYQLAVNGSIRTKEIVAESNWSDFVFDDDYRLMPLEEVEQYIQQNGHLPDIPSAEEVAANGVSLGEMQARLLQKIEELTLYVIQQQKMMQQLMDENVRLRQRLDALEQKM